MTINVLLINPKNIVKNTNLGLGFLNVQLIKKGYNTPLVDLCLSNKRSAGNGGASVGAVIYAYNSIPDKKSEYVFTNAYRGSRYLREEANKFLHDSKVKCKEFKTKEEVLKKTAAIVRQ